MSVEEAQHLLVASDQFGLARLRALCERRLVRTLEPRTAAFTLVLADQHRAAALRSAALAHIAANALAVMGAEGGGWAHLQAAGPGLMGEVLATLAAMRGGAEAGGLLPLPGSPVSPVADGSDAQGRRARARHT